MKMQERVFDVDALRPDWLLDARVHGNIHGNA